MHECAINRKFTMKDLMEKRQQYLKSIKNIEEIEIKLAELNTEVNCKIINGNIIFNPKGKHSELIEQLQYLKKIRYDQIFNSNERN